MNTTVNACLGTRVRIYRQIQGLKQQAFAELLGISQSELSRIENGSKDPRWSLVVLMAKHLHCQLNDLHGEGSMPFTITVSPAG